MAIKCPKCHSENPDASHFCADCGTKLFLPNEALDTRTITPERFLALAPGENICVGKYKILQELGRGGMGVVYKAEDIKLRRTVALKFLPSDLTRNAAAKERFIQEAQAASALDHNNICTIHEIDETDDGQLFIVMAFYEGDTLKKRIEATLLELEKVVDIALQVAQGLAKAHEHGIVHRDVKSANIIVTKEGIAKIVDFGLAKLAGQTQLTKTATTMGTIAYMSPEQSRGEKVDHRTDLWAFGVMLYEMITGRLPFWGEHEQAVIYSILNTEPEPIRKLRADVPRELEHIVELCLKKDVDKRCQQAREIVDALSSLSKKIESGRLHRSKEEIASRKRRKKYMAVALAVGTVFLCTVAYFLWRQDQTRRLENILSRVRRAADARLYDDVFDLMLSSGLRLQDLRDEKLLKQISGNLSVQSIPPKVQIVLARIRSKPSLSLGEPMNIGRTPLEAYLLVAGEYQLIMTFEGMNSLKVHFELKPGDSLRTSRTLVKKSKELSGMARIEPEILPGGAEGPAFFMDEHEVTNAEFFNFISAGGYREQKFWVDPLIINGRPSTWEQARTNFVDKTGIAGPRFWSEGRYTENEKDYPVVGISWYEAMAYARWAEKDLPTWGQWWQAALGGKGSAFPWGDDVMTSPLRANFGHKGPQRVESYPLGISPFGCYDMAGNVREWLRDSKSPALLRTVVGGSWQDPGYMFEASHAEFFSPDFSSNYIGFRCVKAISAEQNKRGGNGR